jgi:DNA-binding FadR family transcriptional regulator
LVAYCGMAGANKRQFDFAFRTELVIRNIQMPNQIRGNLTQGVLEKLGVAIVRGNYGPHEKFLNESELSEQFGVSRSVLREAVKMLTAKGLLSARPRQGTRIEPEYRWNLLDPDVLRWMLDRKFSLELLLEFTEVRMAIEPVAAAMAAVKHTEATLAPIREAIEGMKAAQTGGEDPLEVDIKFHVAILRASDNRFFLGLEGLIETALRISMRLTHQLKPAANVADHKKVLDAIEERNPEKAHAVMSDLIQEVMSLIAVAREAKND